MEVAASINPSTAAVKIIDIADDDKDDDDDDDDVSIIYSTSKTPNRKRAKITDPIPVEEYFESFRSKPSSSSSRTKTEFIDLSEEQPDDETEILGSKFPFPNSNSNPIDNNFMCEICVDEKPMTENFKIMGCNHSYCNQCTSNYISSKLQLNISRISCPVLGCDGQFDPHYCRSILPKEVFDRWGDALCESMIMDSEKFYCPYKNCSALLINDENRGCSNLVITQSECPECKRLFCVACKVPWHKGIVCEEFQKLEKDDESGRDDDILLMKLAERRQWQRCPKCRIYVARTHGCPSMICRCGCAFCYTCGVESTNHCCTNTPGPFVFAPREVAMPMIPEQGGRDGLSGATTNWPFPIYTFHQGPPHLRSTPGPFVFAPREVAMPMIPEQGGRDGSSGAATNWPFPIYTFQQDPPHLRRFPGSTINDHSKTAHNPFFPFS